MTASTLSVNVHSERQALLPSVHKKKTTKSIAKSSSTSLPIKQQCVEPQAPVPPTKPSSCKVVVEPAAETAAAPSTAKKSTSVTQMVQYAVSLSLLGLCVGLCTAGILSQQTPVAQATNPLISLGLMWVLILWLGLLEGGQGCLVGLQPIDAEQFRTTHPHTFASTQMVSQSKEDLNRFIVGRQFLVVLVVFLLNLCCTTVDGTVVPGIPPALMDGLVTSGLAVMLITVILGQLAAEVNATNCMLDFINTPLVVATTAICLIIEESGLLHAVYVVQCFFSGSGAMAETETKSALQQVWYWSRVAVSVSLLAGAMVVTCAALWHGETTMYPGLSTIESFVLFTGLVCFLGLLEAIQIAVFAVVKLPPKVVAGSPAAKSNCDLVFQGRNFKATLIGRQICVTTCMFLLARITTTDVDPEDLVDTSETNSTVLGVPAFLQDFFNTGLPGALITTIVASLVWRIVAASYPLAFMANPVVHWTIRLCLCLEASGVFSAAWLMADGIKWIFGFQTDDVYLDETVDVHAVDLESGSVTSAETASTRRSDNSSLTDYGSDELSR